MPAVTRTTLTRVVLATVLTGPLEVLALATGWLRSALMGWLSLIQGRTGRDIADDMAVALASGIPTACLVGIAATVILIGTR